MRFFRASKKVGYCEEDMVVDGLVMTVSSDQKASIETLEVIEYTSSI